MTKFSIETPTYMSHGFIIPRTRQFSLEFIDSRSLESRKAISGGGGKKNEAMRSDFSWSSQNVKLFSPQFFLPNQPSPHIHILGRLGGV